MNLLETLLWYLGNILDYGYEMLPCMALALAAFLLLRPARRRRLARLGLSSGPWREGALLLFVMFGAGLAALTLFPANLWRHVMNFLWNPQVRAGGLDVKSFYPSWEQTVAAAADLSNILAPFQEIRRAMRGSPWLVFMLLGNIGMFLPVGFFPALLGRRPRWWKAVLTGCLCSCTIEFIQFFIGRSTDIDDVILNTAGALAGYWLFWLLRALFPRFTARFQCREREDP